MKQQTNHIVDVNKTITAHISKMETTEPVTNNHTLTAVKWFFKWFNDNQEATHKEYAKAFEQAKQMEKEQIEKAFSHGQETPLNHPTLPHYSGEEYYNETYKTK